MSVDAVAVLRIPGLVVPTGLCGAQESVTHSGDASLFHTMIRFHGHTADEHALYLRRILGVALDAHDDPRGVLFFPDAVEPSGEGYDAIVAEVSQAGVWAPKVELDHVPARYTSPQAATRSHDHLLGQMIEVMGRDAALQLDLLAQALQLNALVIPDRDVLEFQEQLATVSRAMGEAFANEYAASLRELADAHIRTAQAWPDQLRIDATKTGSLLGKIRTD